MTAVGYFGGCIDKQLSICEKMSDAHVDGTHVERRDAATYHQWWRLFSWNISTRCRMLILIQQQKLLHLEKKAKNIDFSGIIINNFKETFSLLRQKIYSCFRIKRSQISNDSNNTTDFLSVRESEFIVYNAWNDIQFNANRTYRVCQNLIIIRDILEFLLHILKVRFIYRMF